VGVFVLLSQVRLMGVLVRMRVAVVRVLVIVLDVLVAMRGVGV